MIQKMDWKKKLLLAAICFSYLAVSAGDIRGVIVDSTDKSSMINATVRVLRERDSSYVAGGMSDIDGRFVMKGLPRGKYIVEASYLGYRNAWRNVTLANSSSKVTVDSLQLVPSGIMLKEAEVVGVKTEVKVMEDTVEYNAGSYKTQPSAVVEDLLKRLPGVEVDSEGKITAQGKEITKILIDGKEFFSDDAQVASKNIPADIVDKLQVIDRKSDLARLTGVDDGEDETVINLTIKKGMKRGWFGNATAGYGTDDRYSANFMVNHFINDNQISILGNANNINELGFSDPGSGRFRRFGGVNGVNTSQSIGVNFNVGKGEEFRVGGDLMYSHSDQLTLQKASKQYLFVDSTSYENSESNARDRNPSVRGNFRMKWEVDSFNTLEFRPRFTVSFNNSEKTDTSFLRAGDADLTPINRAKTIVESEGTSYDLEGRIVYNHKMKSHPGRSFSTQVTYKYSNTKEDETSYAINEFFLVPDDNEERDQFTDSREWSNRVGARVTWMEPLGDIKKARFLSFAYNMNYYFNNADKLVYDRNREFDAYEAVDALENQYGILTNPMVAYQIADATGVLDEDLSNRFRNDQFSQQVRIGYQQNRKTYRLNGGVSINPTMMQSEDIINSARNIPRQWVWNFAPFMRFRYSFSKTKNLAVDYRGSTQSPTMSQLQPVADVSDPLRVVVGNPSLLPAFQHRFNIRYNDFNQEKQRSLMAFVGASTTMNSIISKTTYDQSTGGQTTTYTNVDGVWSANGMVMFTTPFGNRNWHFSNHAFLRFSRTVGFNNELLNRSSSYTVSETPSLAYRTDLIDFELRPYYNLQMTRNSIQQNSDRNVHSYGARFDANYYAPFGLVLGSDFSYGNTSGYSEGFDNEQWLWNASISYQFLRNRQATITLKAYDLLQQKQNISRSVTANYIQDREFNTVTRYFMLSFSYKFQSFANGSSEKDFDYGGHGPGRRPMGPPPGHPRRPM